MKRTIAEELRARLKSNSKYTHLVAFDDDFAHKQPTESESVRLPDYHTSFFILNLGANFASGDVAAANLLTSFSLGEGRMA